MTAIDGLAECTACDWSAGDADNTDDYDESHVELQRDDLIDLDDDLDEPARPSQRTRMRRDEY